MYMYFENDPTHNDFTKAFKLLWDQPCATDIADMPWFFHGQNSLEIEF